MTATDRADIREAGHRTVTPGKASQVSADFRRELVLHLPHLRMVARALTGRRDRADDLVNDTVMRALAGEAQFQPDTKLRAWLLTILRNGYLTGVRRSRIEVGTIGEIPENALPAPANQDHAVEVIEVWITLQLISVEHREILVLIAAGGLTYEEEADVCGCPVGTIKSRLNRARSKLKHALGRGKA